MEHMDTQGSRVERDIDNNGGNNNTSLESIPIGQPINVEDANHGFQEVSLSLVSQELQSSQLSLSSQDIQNLQSSLPFTISQSVDWESLAIERIEKPLEVPHERSIVAPQPQPVDTDWTQHFTTDEVFETKGDMHKWLMMKAKQRNMSLVIERSDFRAGKCGRVSYMCHRSGKYDDKPRKKRIQASSKDSNKECQTVVSRKCGTQKCECPFKIKTWSKRLDYTQWVASVVCGKHNHDLSPYIEGHAYHGRLTKEQKENCTKMTKAGIKPKQILRMIKDQDPENSTCIQTIYNIKKSIVKEEMNDQTVLQQLMKVACERDFIVNDRRSIEGDNLLDLFLAHPDSIALSNAFPYIFLMDSTCKTNIHKCPFFTIVGVTSTMKTFSAAFVFMEHETTDHFVWALERFRDILHPKNQPLTIVTDREQALINARGVVFPQSRHLLCRWHIECAIVKKANSVLPKDGNDPSGELKAKWKNDWNTLVFSSTEDVFTVNLNQLKEEWQEWPELYVYVEKEWINPHKEKFVAAWTDKVLHFGNVSTERVESAHSALKDMMRCSSRNSLLTAFDYINAHIEHQVNEIKRLFTLSLTTRSHNHRLAIFDEISHFVSTDCLSLLRREYDRYKEEGCIDRETCGCVSVSSYGLPCACWIAEVDRTTRRISMGDLHEFWKKLSITSPLVESEDLELYEEYHLLCKKWKTASPHVKRDMLRRLRDITTPQTTWLNTPSIPVKPNGCSPKRKRAEPNEWDTRRESSAHEMEEPSVPKAPEGQHYNDPNDTPSGKKRDTPSGKKRVTPKTKGKQQVIASSPLTGHTQEEQLSVGPRSLVYIHAKKNDAVQRDDFESEKAVGQFLEASEGHHEGI